MSPWQRFLSFWLTLTLSIRSHRQRAANGLAMALNYFDYWLICSVMPHSIPRIGVYSTLLSHLPRLAGLPSFSALHWRPRSARPGWNTAVHLQFVWALCRVFHSVSALLHDAVLYSILVMACQSRSLPNCHTLCTIRTLKGAERQFLAIKLLRTCLCLQLQTPQRLFCNAHFVLQANCCFYFKIRSKLHTPCALLHPLYFMLTNERRL